MDDELQTARGVLAEEREATEARWRYTLAVRGALCALFGVLTLVGAVLRVDTTILIGMLALDGVLVGLVMSMRK